MFIKLNVPLFEWVIENLCKNAIDAMDGVGKIDIFVTIKNEDVLIDVKDTGKGMDKRKFKVIFTPGFTTKKRGWGLGLSLAKRIIEEYHGGKIFVKQSELNIGTVFRIILKAN
jgi:signal transduction histidine kinase